MSQPIIVTNKKSRYAGLSFLSLLMALLSGFCMVAYTGELRSFPLSFLFVFVGGIGVVFFGACLIFYIKRLFSNNLPPAVQIDDKGVTDNSSAIAIGFIPWEDIAYIHLQPHLNQTYVSVTLKDNDKYLAKMNWLQKYSCKANLKMGFPLVNIVFTTTNQTAQQVYWQIVQQYGHKFIEQEQTNTAN